MMMSDLPQEDRFKLLAVGIFMDGETGEGARPGAANLARLGFHEETWKQLLRRTVAAGWLILRERGGSRKGPNGTRIKRASRYAASVPPEVYDRHREILAGPPFRTAATKEARGSKEAPEEPAQGDLMLPSKNGAPSKEAQHASFEAPPPVDNWSGPVYEGSPPSCERSAQALPSTPSNQARESTKEASGVYEGSIRGLRRKPLDTSPSISSSSISTSSIRSDLIGPVTKEAHPAEDLGDAVQDRRGARWLHGEFGADDATAALVIRHIRADARGRGIPIRHMRDYLATMHDRGDLVDIVLAAQDRVEGRGTPWGRAEPEQLTEPEPEPEEPPPLRAITGTASTNDSTSTQPSLLLHAVPDDEPATRPTQDPPRDLGLPTEIVIAALDQLTMHGWPYQAAAARYFEAHGIDATETQLHAYALQLAWGSPKDRDALRGQPGVAAALDQTG